MCKSKKLQQTLIDLFEEKVGQIPTEIEDKARYIIPAYDRNDFKKVIQSKWPDLRYRNINGLNTIDDFAVKIEQEIDKKEKFFEKALGIIREVSGHPEYTFVSVLFEEEMPRSTDNNARQSKEANYFLKCNKVYQALGRQMHATPFLPNIASLERAKNLKELIDLYYRKGLF